MSKKHTRQTCFYDYISPEPNSGCWLWMGPDNGRGYGRVWAKNVIGKRAAYAHHISLLFERGIAVADGHVVRHRCDIGFCVNPDHLSVGTQIDNIADRQARSRQARGTRTAQCRLTPEAIHDIRSRAVPQAEYAKRYGVTPGHICRIQSREKWGHL